MEVSWGRILPGTLEVQGHGYDDVAAGAELSGGVVGRGGPEKEWWVHTEKMLVCVREVPTESGHGWSRKYGRR